MGVIWMADDLLSELPVAIKLLRDDPGTSKSYRAYLGQRLIREARATAAARHPAIIRALDYGVAISSGPYLVLEPLEEGRTLADHLHRGRRLTPEQAIRVMLPVADGLAAIHAQGIVHRDLKPQNIFLARDTNRRITPKIIDFGLAKVPASDQRGLLTDPGVLIGTPNYIAPEQVIGASTVDGRADIWSFSVVLYELLSGYRPFTGRSTADVVRAVLCDEATPLAIDPGVWGLVRRGLRKHPGERWSEIHEFGVALAHWLTGRGVIDDITGVSLRTHW